MKGRRRPVAIGSARWWRNALVDVGLRLAGLIVLVVALGTEHLSGVELSFGIAAAVAMGVLLVIPVMVCVMALRSPARLESRMDRGADT